MESLIVSMEPILVSAEDAARLLGMGKTLFYELNSSGQLGPMAVKFNTKTLWSRKELQKWVDAGCPSRVKWEKIKAAEKN